MAQLRVKITSKEMVRPSFPTPDHLKTLHFSFRDQISPTVHMPNILYYHQNQISDFESSILLKKSLSETLVQFYPLAGRIHANSIDCNDQGVLFYEASVSTSLVQFMENPNNIDDLLRLLPFPPYTSSFNIIVFGIQVNYFLCGGMAISTCLSHKVADASTLLAFVDAWASKARGDYTNNNNSSNSVSEGKFLSSTFFPYMSQLDEAVDTNCQVCKEKIVTRRLIFDKKTLDSLREECVDGVQERPPSNGQVVTAFIWKQFIKATKARLIPPKTFSAAVVVNLRTVKSSPIPKTLLGNVYWTTLAHVPVEAKMKYPEAVDKLRNSVKLIDKTYIEKMKSGDCVAELRKQFQKSSPEFEGDFFIISDCNKLPFYEVNFGWGKPIWVSMTALPFKNMVFLMGTRCGEGVEAWVNVLEQEVAALEREQEFVSVMASHNNIRAKM